MKFLCDRCKTRYSIGDDRVRGKILKIRCKNCANVITVREGMTDAEVGAPEPSPRRTAKPTTLAPPAQVSAPTNGAKPPAALEEEWYVSIDGEQSGPFSLHEAQRWIGNKPPAADLHCWSEGFDDWLPVDKVSHFRGLRKRATASVPVVPPAPPPRAPPPPPPEEEPKPLFAATMAAIERSAAAAAAPQQVARSMPLGGTPARSTPLGGTPSHPTPSAPSTLSTPSGLGRSTPLGGTPSRATGAATAIPKVSNGSSQHAAIGGALKAPIAVPSIPIAKNATGPRPALPLPAFDASEAAFDPTGTGDAPTQIEVPPFGEDAPTAGAKPARLPTQLPAPFSAAPAGFGTPAPVGKTPAPLFNAAPMMAAPMPAPVPKPMFDSPPIRRPMPEPEPEPDGDMEIGEVSRVVNLADLARTSAQAKAAAARKNGAAPRLRATGGVSSLGGDPIAAMVATPDAGYPLNGAMVPDRANDQAATGGNKKLYLLLGGVVVLLLGIVAAVVYIVSKNGDDDSTALVHGRDIDLARPDDPHDRHDPTGPVDNKPDVKDPNTNPVPHPHRPIGPNVPVGSGKPPPIDDPPSGNSLKPDEVEAMARAQSEATNRCYMRAQRGADAILVGEVKRINVTLTIDKEGLVNEVDLSDHATDSLGKCLQARIKGWKFHPSGNGLKTRLTLVFQAN